MILKSTSRRIYKVMSERRQIRTSAEPFHSCQGPSIRSWHLFTSPSVLAELDVTAWRDLLAVARGWVRRWHEGGTMSQACRVPKRLEQSTNATGVDPRAIELHMWLNGALERGDVVEICDGYESQNANY